MSQVVDVPVKVEPDAAARVAELGFQRELAQMIEYARSHTWGVLAIHVTLEHDHDCPEMDPLVCLWVFREVPPEGPENDKIPQRWRDWLFATFPHAVTMHLHMTTAYGGPDGW